MTVLHKATHIFDVLGIGFGPSNIALAIALEEVGANFNTHFIESAPQACWHPEMLLDGSDIQNNPIRDLVTLRNPCSRYSFTNYLKCEGRLFDYLNLSLSYPFRKDYARYIQWVAAFFAHQVTYSSPARSISYDDSSNYWIVETDSTLYASKAIVLGTGRSRKIPTVFISVLGERIFHLCDYLKRIESLSSELKQIAVIGASQSAVEIHNDLMARFPKLEIHAIHRSFAMQQKDTSPFSDHVYFPSFVEYFFSVDDSARAELQRQLRRTNYSAADLDVLHKLYTTLYEERLDGRTRFHIHNNTTVEAVELEGEQVQLSLYERFLKKRSVLNVDAVVLATGFRDLGACHEDELYPPLLAKVASRLARRHDGVLDVARDYRVTSDTGLALYFNGLCESSHGLGDAGSFSLLALRSTEILNSLKCYFEHIRHCKHSSTTLEEIAITPL